MFVDVPTLKLGWMEYIMIIKNLVDMTNTTLVNNFTEAIEWEKCDMLLTLNADAIKKQQSIISSDDATAEEIKVAQDRLAKLEKEQSTLKARKESDAKAHENIIIRVISELNEYTSNNETAIRNYLRLSCCDDNSKFFKLAILTEVKFEEFYDAMVSLHDMDSNEVTDCGLRRYAGASEEKAKKLSEDIQKIIKGMFSIPLENDITKKVNVKFNKTDMNCVHETFVSGLTVDVSKSKKGNSVDGMSFRYAIEKVENKKTGAVSYKGVRFKETLAKLAFHKIFK